MTQYLPANLLALFAPRDPLPYLPPPEPKHSKEVCNLVGVGEYVNLFEDPEETPEPQKVPTRAEKKETKRTDKEDKQKNYIDEELLSWDPHNDANAAGDAFKTVFVARINYDTREDKLRREFEEFGPIRHIHMATDTKTGKPRGYAFIEYETERGMRSAFKYGDGRKIDGKRVVVDSERGRTVKNWRPRRLGGGLGGTRIGAPDQNITHSGRVEPREYTEKLARASRQRERALRRSKSGSAERGERRASKSAEPGDRDGSRGDRDSRQTSATKERSPKREERKRGDERERREDRDRSRRDDRGGRDRDRDRDRRRSGRDREDRGDRRRDDRSRRDDGDRDRSRREDDDRKRGEDDKKRGEDVVQDDDKEEKERDRSTRDRSDKRDRDDSDRKRGRDDDGDRKRDRDDDDRKRDRDDDRDRKRGREDRGEEKREERSEDKREERSEDKREERGEESKMDESLSEKLPEVAPEPIKAEEDNGY